MTTTSKSSSPRSMRKTTRRTNSKSSVSAKAIVKKRKRWALAKRQGTLSGCSAPTTSASAPRSSRPWSMRRVSRALSAHIRRTTTIHGKTRFLAGTSPSSARTTRSAGGWGKRIEILTCRVPFSSIPDPTHWGKKEWNRWRKYTIQGLRRFAEAQYHPLATTAFSLKPPSPSPSSLPQTSLAPAWTCAKTSGKPGTRPTPSSRRRSGTGLDYHGEGIS